MTEQRCKGCWDLGPDDMTKFRAIEEAYRDSCLKWGYKEIRTPTLEYLHLFTSTGTLTPARLNKVYSFLDWDGWSGERVVLRPDGTIPAARLYIGSMEEKVLAKFFYVTNIFMFEETGREKREKWQCGAELIGAGSPLADVELIMLACEVLGKLEIKDVKLKLSHIGLIRGLLKKLDITPAEQDRLFEQILEGNGDALTKLAARSPELEKALPLLLDLKGQSSGFVKNLKVLLVRELPELEPELNDFIAIVDLLDTLECRYQIDITAASGFEYYTGVTFQLFAGDDEVGGGGRYDALIPLMGGKDTPASGFALYVDRLMDLIEAGHPAGSRAHRILLSIDSHDRASVSESFNMARLLRSSGYIAEFSLGAQRPADFRWTLDVRGKAPRFVLTDRTKRKKTEANNADEVLALLGH
ncbi:MAG: ATP phosphoribosyltransferase regulatory subunit [Chloroflexi bacterium]|nr:ATP phosphoribosyltransferase regulatory subunit [Chloroflexota bacterium]